jgi:hypothetical protein
MIPSAKVLWISVGVVFVTLFALWEPEQFGPSLVSMLRVAIRIVMLVFAAFLAHQAYDSIRSGLTGAQPRASAPNDDPTAISTRFGGIAWGLICSALSVGLAGLTLGLFGRFP